MEAFTWYAGTRKNALFKKSLMTFSFAPYTLPSVLSYKLLLRKLRSLLKVIFVETLKIKNLEKLTILTN